MDYDPNNIFARIIRGDLTCHKVWEDADTLAFMDIMPMTRGHVLVLSKAPARNLFDIADADLKALIVAVRRTAAAVTAAFACDGVTVQQFNEEAGGQSVFHLHFHVLPRWLGKPLAPHGTGQADAQSLSADAEQIRRHLV